MIGLFAGGIGGLLKNAVEKHRLSARSKRGVFDLAKVLSRRNLLEVFRCRRKRSEVGGEVAKTGGFSLN